MNFFEAMTMLHQGKKIRLPNWDKRTYIGLKETGFKFCGIGKVEYSILNEKGEKPSQTYSTGYPNNCVHISGCSGPADTELTLLNNLLKGEWEEFKEE